MRLFFFFYNSMIYPRYDFRQRREEKLYLGRISVFEKWIKRLRDIARGEEKSEMPRPLENAGEETTTWKFVIEGLAIIYD